jgi:hypothetical protein
MLARGVVLLMQRAFHHEIVMTSGPEMPALIGEDGRLPEHPG